MSAKFRISAWFIAIIVILMVIMVVFVVTVDKADVIDDAANRLTDVVLTNEEDFQYRHGSIDWDELEIFERGVYCAFYDKNGNMLHGTTVDNIGSGLPFEEYVINTVTTENDSYYVYDAYVEVMDTGVWVRGVIPVNDGSGLMRTLELVTYALLPTLFVITVFGAVLITRQVFNPMNKIIDAANSISGGDDLSARIALKKAPSEMMALSSTFDSMFDRLERSFESERQFTSDASHELRTPIAVIHAQCERSRRKDRTPEDYLCSIEVIDEQSRRISLLIDQLLSLTRLQQGTERYPMKSADLSSFVSSCCREFEIDDFKGITLKTDIAENVTASFNSALMSSVICNLLQNACKYGRENGHISVSLREDDMGIRLSVADDGIGIPEDVQDKIWNRFWQGDSSRGIDGGSGLGLSLVKEMVELHGGSVSVSSEPGKGSVFTVTLLKE